MASAPGLFPASAVPAPGSRQARRRASGGLRWHLAATLWAVILGGAISPWSRGLVGDIWWHLATGAWMVAHRAIPWTNPFGSQAGATPWINLEWGWDALTGLLVHAFGPDGLLLWAGVLWLGIALSQWRRLARWRVSATRRTDTTLLALFGTVLFWAWRPQLVSYALIGVWWGVLESAYDRPRRLWLLVPVLLVWEQLHGGFLLGLISLAWWIGDRAWRGAAFPLTRDAWRSLGPVLAALGAVLGLTPWGYGLVGHALAESRNPALYQWIAEWQSPTFHNPIWFGFLGVPVLAWGVWLYGHPDRIRRAPRWLWGLFALTLGMTLVAGRNLPFFWLAFATLLAVTAPGRSRSVRVSAPVAGIMAALALGFLVWQAPHWTAPHRGLSPRIVATLRQQPGPILNGYRAGDDLIAWGLPTSVDGRTDLWIAAGTFPATVEMEQGLWAWPRIMAWCAARHIRWILWPLASPGAHELAGQPGWRLVAQTARYGLWTRAAPLAGGPS